MDLEALEGACGLPTITTISSSSASRPSDRPPPPVHGDSGQQQPSLGTKTNKKTTSNVKEQGDNDRAVERNNNNDKKRNRQRRQDDAYQLAYRGFAFTPVPSTGRPGTPHCFFAESYTVQYQEPPLGDDKGDDNDSNTIVTTNVRNMRVHRHANGLCVVATNGLADRATGSTTTSTSSVSVSSVLTSQEPNQTRAFQWRCQPVPDLSAAQKRKRVAAMLKQKPQQQPQQGAVRPTDPLVTVTDQTATAKETTIYTTTYPAVVFGSVLEVNTELTLDLLRQDPLLKGYLAVILPSGPFPPPPSNCCLPQADEARIIKSDAPAESEAKINA